MGAQELVLVLDFGSQYSQLIARRVREAGVYCELIDGSTSWSVIRDRAPRALILSGGPASVYGEGAPLADPAVLKAGVPVLGICYGMQLLAHQLGGKVVSAGKREYGPASVRVEDPASLFKDLPLELPVWMSHGDTILEPPAGFRRLARSDNSTIAAMTDDAGDSGSRFIPRSSTPRRVGRSCGISSTRWPAAAAAGNRRRSSSSRRGPFASRSEMAASCARSPVVSIRRFAPRSCIERFRVS